jgi:hypothetical protein
MARRLQRLGNEEESWCFIMFTHYSHNNLPKASRHCHVIFSGGNSLSKNITFGRTLPFFSLNSTSSSLRLTNISSTIEFSRGPLCCSLE